MIRVTAHCICFIRKITKHCPTYIDRNISSFDYQYALIVWIKAAQLNSFRDVFENLNDRKVQPLAFIRQKRLYIDSQGIIRWGGRFFQHSDHGYGEISNFPTESKV